MAVAPNTLIRLLKIPFLMDNKNQLTFSNLEAQTNYFLGREYVEVDETEYTYQRKDNIIRFPAHLDDIIEYNYVMYKNNNYSNKWFYAFITNMTYENDGLTNISIETDVFQTWQFDIQYKKCFVEREHVNDDTVGLNIVDEGLQTSEYVANKINYWLNSSPYDIETNENLVIVIGATSDKDKNPVSGVQTDGIYAGLRFYVFHNNSTGINQLNSWLEDYARNGISSAIKCMFMFPESLTTGADRTDHLYAGSNTTITRWIRQISSGNNIKAIDLTNNSIDGYIPKNSKLLQYPYNYLLVSNNNGSEVVYRLEDFYTKNNDNKEIKAPSFRIDSVMTPSGSVRMIPENYKGGSQNDIEGINLGKYPICNWDTDVFTNWLTQNGINIGLSVASSALTIAGGIGMMGSGTEALAGASSIVSGAMGIANTLGEIYKENLVPPQSNGNTNCGDVVTASGKNDFIFYNMSIKKENAIILDNFFSMFGYKVNSLKVPNIKGRRNWNYVKTSNCNFVGNIPQNDLQKIHRIFNEGVTFWHQSSTFLDYSQDNDII